MTCRYRLINGKRCKKMVIGTGFEYCATHWQMTVGDEVGNDRKDTKEIYS